jgi:acetyltransferase
MEIIVGIKYDDIFGPVVVCGLGGIYTEVFKKVDFFILPLNLEEVKSKLLAGKMRFIFEKTRGQMPYDISELANIIFRISQLALEADNIKEIDINPLLVYNDGEKAVAVDVKIIL